MTIQKFVSLIHKGWSLDHIFALEHLSTGKEIAEIPRGQAILQALIRKGMIDVGLEITEQGKQLLEFAHNENTEEMVKIEKPRMSEGLEGLHKKLEDILIQHTGKKQVRVEIYGTKYSFLCNEKDLVERTKKVMARYGLSDFQKIEECLVKYVETCCKTRRYTPLVEYFITKTENGIEKSRLVTALRDGSGEKEDNNSQKASVIDI